MKRFFAPWRGFLALFLLVLLSVPALAQPSVAPLPKQTFRMSPFSPIADQLQTLLPNLAPASSAPPASATILQPPAAGSNALLPTSTTAPLPDTGDTEPQETFGTKALNLLISEAEVVHSESNSFISNFSAWPQLCNWFDQQIHDPRLGLWAAVGVDLVHVVLPALIAALIAELLFLPVRSALRRRRPPTFFRRLAALVLMVGTRLIPVIIFIGTALTMLDENETHKFPRFIILNLVYALTLSRILGIVVRGLFAPTAPTLRLVPATDDQAKYASRWIAAYGIIIIYGYFLVDVARGIRVPSEIIAAFTNVFGLALVIMTLVVIVQKRAVVASLIRGNLSAAQPDLTMLEYLRLWFARRWHTVAIAYIVLGYLITALGVENGFALLLRGTILTLVILVVMRLLLHATARYGANDADAATALHHTILRALMRFLIWAVAILGVLASWGANLPAFFATPLGQRIMGGAFSIGTTLAVVAVIYGLFNSAVEKKLNRRDAEGKALQASARMRTLLPMLRNTILIIFTVIVSMVVLSEAGFNIGPLLAGAGIFGVALGFGSQTLVKDFLTGLFIVIENTIAIGDVIKIGDHSGVVDVMSIRTLRLRDADGALHILPYSEVTKIINMTKDYAFAVIDVSVAYDSDLDKVMDVIREVGDDMQKDPIFKRVILEPVEVLGVETLGDSSITIRSRLRTRPGKQWDVRRMFLLKMKRRFDKEGIEIPFPTVTNIQRPHKGE